MRCTTRSVLLSWADLLQVNSIHFDFEYNIFHWYFITFSDTSVVSAGSHVTWAMHSCAITSHWLATQRHKLSLALDQAALQAAQHKCQTSMLRATRRPTRWAWRTLWMASDQSKNDSRKQITMLKIKQIKDVLNEICYSETCPRCVTFQKCIICKIFFTFF